MWKGGLRFQTFKLKNLFQGGKSCLKLSFLKTTATTFFQPREIKFFRNSQTFFKHISCTGKKKTKNNKFMRKVEEIFLKYDSIFEKYKFFDNYTLINVRLAIKKVKFSYFLNGNCSICYNSSVLLFFCLEWILVWITAKKFLLVILLNKVEYMPNQP